MGIVGRRGLRSVGSGRGRVVGSVGWGLAGVIWEGMWCGEGGDGEVGMWWMRGRELEG